MRATRREFVALAAAVAARAEKIPPKGDTFHLMRKVNGWQIANPIMKADDRNWERGTWYTGVMAAWRATRDRAYYQQSLKWGQQHNWQVGTEPANGANRLFCVETWLELYFAEKNKAMIQPAIDWLATNAPNSPGGAKRWYVDDHNLAYVDSLYGAVALAMLTKATGDPKYIDIMHAFFDDVTGELFDRQAGLYYRDNRFLNQKTRNGRKVLWSRGNGWAFAGIARLLDYLPEQDSRRDRYLNVFRQMAAALIERQGVDGLWRPNLDDAEEVPVPETSGTGFFCFGMACGINHGVLDRSKYLPAVGKAWSGLARSVAADGKVLWGQQVDGQPNPVKRDSSHEYVTGTFLLAGSEVSKLSGAV